MHPFEKAFQSPAPAVLFLTGDDDGVVDVDAPELITSFRQRCIQIGSGVNDDIFPVNVQFEAQFIIV